MITYKDCIESGLKEEKTSYRKKQINDECSKEYSCTDGTRASTLPTISLPVL
jgi:hypothetical protein